eukprot:6237401-Pyramimonas_sp.AAC.2
MSGHLWCLSSLSRHGCGPPSEQSRWSSPTGPSSIVKMYFGWCWSGVKPARDSGATGNDCEEHVNLMQGHTGGHTRLQHV